MFDLNKIAPIELQCGPHGSASDGLCFMEMVAWFEGEAHSDKPECACPVLGAYGIGLNDAMPHDLRNELLRPLVMLMAGTRDQDSKQKRGEFLAMWSVNKILPIALRAAGFETNAVECELASNLVGAAYAAYAAAYAAENAAYAAYAAAYAAENAAANAAENAANAAENAANAAENAANAAENAAVSVWPMAVEGLRQAIMIGRHEGFTALDFDARADALLELVA